MRRTLTEGGLGDGRITRKALPSALDAALRRRLGLGAGARLEILEEADGLKLRVIRSVPAADMAGLAGMAVAPSRGVARRLEDFDPASALARHRAPKP